MNRLTLGILFVALVAACGYYKFGYVPNLLREDTEKALDEFAQAIASQERSKVAEALDAHLTDNAKIHIEVTFFSLTQNGQRPVAEDFTKKEFMTFIDNVLYPLDHYEYTPQLVDFKVNSDRDAAEVVFTSSEWADGKGHYAGVTVGMRFSSDTECTAHVVYPGKVPSISTASCKISLRAVPKPEEAYKIQGNPEAMQQFIMR